MGRKKYKFSCPMGVACKNGPNSTKWVTDQCDTQEMAKYQLDQHLKYAHSQPQEVRITVPDSFPLDVSLNYGHPIEYLQLHDLSGNNEFKYGKKKNEYQCRECNDQEFKSIANFKKHLYKQHLIDVDMGKNNRLKKPYLKRVVPSDEIEHGKFICDNVPCKRRFFWKKDLDNHKDKLCSHRYQALSKVHSQALTILPNTERKQSNSQAANTNATYVDLEKLSVIIEEISSSDSQSYASQLIINPLCQHPPVDSSYPVQVHQGLSDPTPSTGDDNGARVEKNLGTMDLQLAVDTTSNPEITGSDYPTQLPGPATVTNQRSPPPSLTPNSFLESYNNSIKYSLNVKSPLPFKKRDVRMEDSNWINVQNEHSASDAEPLVLREDFERVCPTFSAPTTRVKDLKRLKEIHNASSSKDSSKEKESFNKENKNANAGRGKDMKRLVYCNPLLEDGAEQQELFADSDSEETLDEITNTPSPSKRPKTDTQKKTDADKIQSDWSYDGHEPSKAELMRAALLAWKGHLTSVECMDIRDMDITDIPLVQLEKLTAIVTERVLIDNMTPSCRLSSILASVQCLKLELNNMKLSEENTRDLFTAMRERVGDVELYNITLDMEQLTKYDGWGRCRELAVGRDTRTRHEDRLRRWAADKGWIVTADVGWLVMERK